ncbi:unnamed protein product [Microthlaspi erraticum]|uniref:Uncharacterized protein n=1 Tax=Microthlaspi erraticum TaxID=1685480 RepID=A0A6D2HPG8_9BRAS|nr:unnamed protein product [Microthlaspi erraticum]
MQFTERAKKLRDRNINNRSYYKIPHTLGKKSICRKSKEIEKLAHTRTLNTGIDEFSQVFGAERPGSVRCVGLGPTPSTFFKNRPTTTAEKTEVACLRNKVNYLEEELEKLQAENGRHHELYVLINGGFTDGDQRRELGIDLLKLSSEKGPDIFQYGVAMNRLPTGNIANNHTFVQKLKTGGITSSMSSSTAASPTAINDGSLGSIFSSSLRRKGQTYSSTASP